MYEHDYDGSLAKTGKRHLGKTRWTREEVRTKAPGGSKQSMEHNKEKLTQEGSVQEHFVISGPTTFTVVFILN